MLISEGNLRMSAIAATRSAVFFALHDFHGGERMRLQPRTSPETDRCMDLIQQLASVVVRDLCVDVGFESVVLTGRADSWHGKQVATSAARSMYPKHRIENLLEVTTVR